jgi:hypothetical protein
MIYATELNCSIPLFRLDINPYSLPKIRHSKLGVDYLNEDIIDLFNDLNLDVVLVEVFYSRPNFYSNIHVDSSGGDINKINWIYGGKDCPMNWYSIKESDKEKSYANTVIGTRYKGFNINEVNLEFSKVLSSPSLVHVGVPHNVHNKKEERWCVSLVYEYKGTKKRPSMEESLIIFKDLIL